MNLMKKQCWNFNLHDIDKIYYLKNKIMLIVFVLVVFLHIEKYVKIVNTIVNE